MNTKQGFIKGAFILLVSNMIVKILGAFFKIPLTNLLGASGIGTFSVAYNIFALIFVISSAGLPVSISKIISENNANGNSQNNRRVVKCALCIFLSISALASLLIFIFAERISIFLGNERAYLSILAIVPAIFVMTIVSILRGFYQGYNDMTKTAISQLLEAVFKLLVGFFFAKHLLELGYDESVASAGAIFGVTLSTIISAIYLIICASFTRRERNLIKPNISNKNVVKKLLNISIPITLSASILALTGIIDMFTILNLLQANGMSETLANTHYGAYNMAMTVYSLPQTLIISLSISIVPGVSTQFAKKSTKLLEKTINTGLLLTTLFAFPCMIGFVTLSTEILNILFYKRPQDVLLASPSLVILACGVVLVSLVTITNSNMQGLSKQFLPLKAIIWGILVKIITNILLIPIHNISGASLGTVLCFMVIAILNLRNLGKIIHLKLDKIILKPLFSSLVMYFFILNIKSHYNLNSVLFLGITIAFSAIIYFLTYFLTSGIKDLKTLLCKKIV